MASCVVCNLSLAKSLSTICESYVSFVVECFLHWPLPLFNGLLLCFLVQALLRGGPVVQNGSYIICSCLVVRAVYLCEKGGGLFLFLLSCLFLLLLCCPPWWSHTISVTPSCWHFVLTLPLLLLGTLFSHGQSSVPKPWYFLLCF